MKKEIKYKIRNAKSGDMAAIESVRTKAWIDTYPNEKECITVENSKLFLQKKKEERKNNKDRIKNFTNKYKDSRTFVAEVYERVIGFCSMPKKSTKGIPQGALYLLPKYHGYGIGSKLFNKSLDWLGRENNIVINVARYNDKAIHLYKKCGFKFDKRLRKGKEILLPLGNSIKTVNMIRRGKIKQK